MTTFWASEIGTGTKGEVQNIRIDVNRRCRDAKQVLTPRETLDLKEEKEKEDIEAKKKKEVMLIIIRYGLLPNVVWARLTAFWTCMDSRLLSGCYANAELYTFGIRG